MAISSNDIGFFNSGSSITNIGLGGPISSFVLTNTLFSDLNSQDSLSGLVDYRCVYIKNLSNSDYFYNFTLSVKDNNYSDVSYGFPSVTRCSGQGCSSIFNITLEEHILNFNYSEGITGSFELIYNNDSFIINWDGDSSFLKNQIEFNLSNILQEDVSVVVDSNICNGNQCTFSATIKYSRPKNYHLLLVKDVDIGVGTNITFSTFRKTIGGPINLVASTIDNGKVIPKNINGSDISFFNNSETFVLNKFGPGEFFPVWLKRATPAGVTGRSSDSFSFNITASNVAITPTPTPTPALTLVLDQSQTLMNNSITVEPNKAYWQSFRAGISGKLSSIDLGFYNKSDDIFFIGKSHLRLYTGSGINTSNIIHSSSIDVAISPGLIYNKFNINVDIVANQVYTVGYFPNFTHDIALNSQQIVPQPPPYLNGSFGIDQNIFQNDDLLFKTYVLSVNPTPTPTPTPTPI